MTWLATLTRAEREICDLSPEVYAFAHPGVDFHIPHAVANSMMLAPVMEFNMLGNLSNLRT